MNRKFIIVVVILVLCAVAFAFGRGWLTLSIPSADTRNSNVSTNQMLDQDKAKEDAAEVTKTTTEPAATPTE